MGKMKDFMMKSNLRPGEDPFKMKGDKMPNAVLKKYADETKMSIQQVEAVWNQAKEKAEASVGKDSPKYWAYVNSITRSDAEAQGKHDVQRTRAI